MTPDLDDSSLRLNALMWAMGYANSLPWWRRPSSPMPMAREMYEFVRSQRPGKVVAIAPTPGAAA
jgi:hypothetical protein